MTNPKKCIRHAMARGEWAELRFMTSAGESVEWLKPRSLRLPCGAAESRALIRTCLTGVELFLKRVIVVTFFLVRRAAEAAEFAFALGRG
jgi:hypothetical protein